jgi:uncharacterized repeat protein (TIGR03803 family)
MTRIKQRQWILVRLTVVAAFAVVFVMTLIAAKPVQAQTFTVLYAFQGGTDATDPSGNLILDESGNLYGTASGGEYGYGAIFKVDATGKETVLYSFTGGDDGAGLLRGPLARDKVGNLYGTAGGGSGGSGTVFKLDVNGILSVIYSFTDYPNLNGGLALDPSGNLYGTTEWGGRDGVGSVFKVDPTGKETDLYEFQGLPDGGYANGGVFRDKAGNLFGTTWSGGAGPCYYAEGCGTVFKLSKTGKETIIYRFLDLPDGAFPLFGVALGSPGNFYSTTSGGGRPGCNIYGPGCGTVFKVNVSGKENVLYRFRMSKNEGVPAGGVVRDSHGNLYGTDYDTLYKLDLRGKKTILHHFTGGDDGIAPLGSLTLDHAGNLYGTTEYGGAYGYGVVFKIAP